MDTRLGIFNGDETHPIASANESSKIKGRSGCVLVVIRSQNILSFASTTVEYGFLWTT